MKIKDGVLISINKSKDIKRGKCIIPDGVTSIGFRAFYYCNKLTSVTIPDSVTSIGDSAFPDDVKTKQGGIYYVDTWVVGVVSNSLSSATIKNGTKGIADFAFNGCSGLTSVTIPDSVTSIGDFAFEGCSGLTSVTIPNSVTSIGWFAFYNCSGLMSVVIPESVTSIGYEAFRGCSGLERLIIPKTIKKIKCVKGFYRYDDKLRCRDFFYEIGKTYKEDIAKLCKSGFHACTLGLDVFNYFAGDNVAYYEVELSGISSERGDDSKICGTAITLLRELTVAETVNYKTSLEKPD